MANLEIILAAIVEPEKIFSAVKFKPKPEGMEIQAFFKANGDKMNFTFKFIHPTEGYCKQQEKMGFYNGWGSAFDKLDSVHLVFTNLNEY